MFGLLKKVNKNRINRKSDGTLTKRARALAVSFVAIMLVVNLGAVAYIMVVKGDDYREAAVAAQLYDEEIEAVRGTIYDCNMTPLATSTESWILCANPTAIKNRFEKYESLTEELYAYVCDGFAMILSIEADDVYALITKEDSSYVRVKKEVTPTQKVELQEFIEAGYNYTVKSEKRRFFKTISEEVEKRVSFNSLFFYESDSLRAYAQSTLASTIIGVVNDDNTGITGLESYYNSYLTGESGRIMTATDSRNRVLDSNYETIFEAGEGNSLVTTVDQNIQYYLENALEQAHKDTQADSVYGIVMSVKTGAILAMSDKPDFDLTESGTLSEGLDTSKLETYEKGTDEYLEEYSSLLYQQWSSSCITDIYEPGSTFKIFTAAAALEEGVANLNTCYNCSGITKVLTQPYHCASNKAHGYQTFTQMLMNSCNCAFIWLGQQIGIESYMKYFEAFGFCERSGVDIGGEEYSVVHKADTMSVVDLASTSFGQSFKITPIQLITATCAIANGGKLMKPYFVDKIIDSDGNVVMENEPTVVRNVVSAETCKQVVSMMEAVVEEGTGKNAYIEGYRVAGKTATAQKLEDKKENGEKEIYVASFVCFAPANDPEVAILICIDNAKGSSWSGGALAAPVAKKVMVSTLDYLNIEPQYTEDELASVSGTAPELVGNSVSQAKIAAASEGYSTRVVGGGDTVISQVPSSGQSIPSGGVIVLYTDSDAKTLEVEVPDFTGLTTSEVNSKAIENGINVVFSTPSDTTGIVAYDQSVSPGLIVEAGTKITVYFKTNNIAQD